MTGSAILDADQAFTRAARGSRRAALKRVLRRDSADERHLPVYSEPRRARATGPRRHEIPLDAISGTLEPSRAAQFDGNFRPVAASARCRWTRIWLAEHRGAVLPPISVVPVGDHYAVRDGHHRVSVARARGAVAIDASIDAL